MRSAAGFPHLEILLRAANEGWQNYLVFEDDALIIEGAGIAEPLENAGYVAARGCFCNRDSCAYFEEGDKG